MLGSYLKLLTNRHLNSYFNRKYWHMYKTYNGYIKHNNYEKTQTTFLCEIAILIQNYILNYILHCFTLTCIKIKLI